MIELTMNQCRQINVNAPLRYTVEALHDQPIWLPEPITDLATIHAIIQGGCASGAYMPAVTYYTASLTMHQLGDEVLQYIEDSGLPIPAIAADESWTGYQSALLSMAVELWAANFSEQLEGVDWD